MKFSDRVQAIFFARKPATPFSLMRIAWAAVMLYSALRIAPELLRYFSDDAFLPRSLEPLILRDFFRFSIFDEIADAPGVIAIYAAYVLSLFAMLLGIRPKLATIVSVVLLFSFHERNPVILNGGDTMLRAIGFLLLISPGVGALSLWRAKKQWKTWKHTKKFLPPLTMPAWPKRLLLWQILVIYGTSLFSKLTGPAWIGGGAAGLVLQNPTFARFDLSPSTIATLSPYLTYGTLCVEALWLLLLIPESTVNRVPFLKKGVLRRVIIFFGILFHVGIFATMKVGLFLPAMLTAYLGILEAEDLEALRNWWNKVWKRENHRTKLAKAERGRIVILHDGQCGLCCRTGFIMLLLDVLHRLTLVDFHDPVARKRVAPDLDLKDLNRALHVRFPDGRTLESFRAFRALTWHLPPLWPVLPFLYLPGASAVGDDVYKKIAARRKKCTHKNCQI